MATPALATHPKIILFTDFDGTVTAQDSNDFLTDNLGFGVKKRKELGKQVIDGTLHFRDAFQQMLDSIDTPFDKCAEALLENIELDSGFKDFYFWSRENNVPVVVVSSGMEPLIRKLLAKLVGDAANDIQIIANHVDVKPDGSWSIVFRDPESGFGHDKAKSIRPYAEKSDRPFLLYAGDGISDLSAAKETDLLFAKNGCDLVDYLEKNKIPYNGFDSYNDISKAIKKLHNEEVALDALRG
ncbi:Pdp3-interacting factor 1 [Wickerhamiella sorbophila]|uniref:Pdp3-interacting factor 1 n=1 Tax=Wickerhamiella sorbophila TaxID=45607 RepID=A0A2T0FCH2_9ASCO|nr:Pdp3-interacting factor 1 [Wickerhamiella sorbophila]PRT52702.1 Pdp3-interacting factor 1 [Wickerhamiella sorbophila]